MLLPELLLEHAPALFEPDPPEAALRPEAPAEQEPVEAADRFALFPELLLPEMPVPGHALAPFEPEPPEEAPEPEAEEQEPFDAADAMELLPEMPVPGHALAPFEPEPAEDALRPEAAAEGEPAEETDALELLPDRSPAEREPAPVEPEAPVLRLLPEQMLDETPPALPEPAEEDGSEDLVDYWDGLRGARAFPALHDLDRARIAALWPNTLLVVVGPSELPRITPLGANNGEIEYTATVIDWIVARSRSAARRGEPTEAEQRFAVSTGGARYRLLLLPVGSDERKSDHMLCQLSQAEAVSAVASFRRWLTG